MINFFKKNGPLKLFSVLLAVLMWIYVVQIENPLFEISIQGVPVHLVNEAQLEAKGLVIVEQNENIMNLRVKGKRQSVIGLKATDVTASVDVGNIQQTGSFSFSPQLSFPEDGISVLERSPRSITITVDKIEDRVFGITPEITGSPKEGYYAERPTLGTKEILVKGPVSVLNQIAKISAVIDVDGAKKDMKKQVKLKIIKDDGTELTSDKVELSTSVITLESKVYPTKKVKLKYDVTGSLELEDYQLDEITISNSAIVIAGTEENLERLDSIHLGSFDLSEVTLQHHKKLFSIPLGDELISVDGIKNVAVEAVLVSGKKKTVEIKSFTLINEPENVKTVIQTEKLVLKLEGHKAALEKVNADSFTVTLDLTGVKKGTHQIEPKIQCNVDGVTVSGEYFVDVLLQQK